MRYLTLTTLALFAYGCMFTSLSAQTELRTNVIKVSLISAERPSLNIVTPADVMHSELYASKKALTQGDYKNALSHAYNIRSIAHQMNEVLPKELPAIELVAHHLQLATMIVEVDAAYRRGAYNTAVFEYNQILLVMKEFGIKPPREVALLAQKINSGLLQPVYILEEFPLPQSMQI